MSRLLIIALGVFLLVGFVWSLRAPVPGIYPEGMAPAPRNDWKWLNGE